MVFISFESYYLAFIVKSIRKNNLDYDINKETFVDISDFLISGHTESFMDLGKLNAICHTPKGSL